MSDSNIMVPVKVDALVIDGAVPRLALSDGKWRSNGSDWGSTIQDFVAPGPLPFFGAKLTGDPGAMDLTESPYVSSPDDCGIYIHWVVPDGLRHGYGAAERGLNFPLLPHNWLVVRIQRPKSGALVSRAWLVETDVAVDSGGSQVVAAVSDDGGNYLAAQRIGAANPFPGDGASGKKPALKVTAVGSDYTGSATFAAFANDNRNVLSFHDDLADFRTPENEKESNVGETGQNQSPVFKKELSGVSFSYIVLGWYRPNAGGDEPLQFVRQHLTASDLQRGEKSAVLSALGWQLDDTVLPATAGHDRASATDEEKAFKTAEAALPADLLQRKALFHGMVAGVNYFDDETYLGPLLGYPGAPQAHAGSRLDRPTVEVGIGNNTADALIAMIAADPAVKGAGDGSGAALWKALEAVLYKEPRSLIENWRETPREQKIHKSWYAPLDGGAVWGIRAQERDAATLLPAGQDPTADAGPDPDLLEAFYDRLEALNALQTGVNEAAREIAARQQMFYMGWWLLVHNVLNGGKPSQDDLEKALTADQSAIVQQQQALAAGRKQVDTASAKLAADLKQAGLQLVSESGARFYAPTDPVIVIKHAGDQEKYVFPSSLICRSAVAPLDHISFSAGSKGATVKMTDVTGPLATIASALQQQPNGSALVSLLHEAGLVEQTLHALTQLTRGDLEANEKQWDKWINDLRDALSAASGDEKSDDAKAVRWQIEPAPKEPSLLSRLGTLWLRQPWRPLFLDWQIRWVPDAQPLAGWQFDPSSHDYRPGSSQAGAPVVLQGRSIMAPQMGRVFSDPIDELEKMLQGDAGFDPRVVAVLKQYHDRWQEELEKLKASGLLGQALSGFHQTLLGRNTMLPHLQPVPGYPWLTDDEYGSKLFYDQAVVKSGVFKPADAGAGMPPVKLPSLTPPDMAGSVPFGLLKSGSFEVEALWIIDDFGQWFDVLGGSSEAHADPIAVSPHNRWPGDGSSRRVAQPPRVLQPARLEFRLVDGDFKQRAAGHPNADPVCGWIFHNFLDQALTLCDRGGRLLGELQLIDAPNGSSVRWRCLAAGKATTTAIADVIADPTLRDFAQALLQTKPAAQVRLQALLALIDGMLPDIRPASGGGRLRIAGRPLALVNARLGLELLGTAWDDPMDPDGSDKAAQALNQLAVPVQLGVAAGADDGLIGYFKRGADGSGPMQQIVAVRQPADFNDSSGYLLDAAIGKDAVRAGFDRNAWQALTLLVDPHAAVHAACGLVPGARLTLPKVYLDRARERFELSFGAAPLLLQPAPKPGEQVTLPVAPPAGWQGKWQFEGPQADAPAEEVLPPTHLPQYAATVAAVEGRLLLRQDPLDRLAGSLAGVLRLNGWRTAADLSGMSVSDRRNTVIASLQAHPKLKEPVATLSALTNPQLCAVSALVAFLDHCGKPYNTGANQKIDDLRNALVVLNQSEAGVSSAQQGGMSDRALIEIGRRWSAAFESYLSSR